MIVLRVLLGLIMTAAISVSFAAPDEKKLGKSNGYPVGTAANWFFDESVRVGSFSQLDKINTGKTTFTPLTASNQPMQLRRTNSEPSVYWRIDGRTYTLDDYLARQRVMGLLVIKDGEILIERYQYDRTPEHRFVSQSMAKSIASLAMGLAVQDKLIASLDARADELEPKLKDTLYGEATIRQLLRMSSGVQFQELYNGKDDLARFNAAAYREGFPAAAKLLTVRDAPAGDKFSYASAETNILSQVFQAATKQNMANYIEARLWQPMGAQSSASWMKNPFGVTGSAGGFNATLTDYGRLGVLLANDGKRPDTQIQIIPKEYLIEATDWKQHPTAFHPKIATPYFGYGYQFWTYPGNKRRFALLGVYGQTIFVDPELKLVMVQTTANATAKSGQTSLGAESDAFWRGLVNKYGRWD